MKFNKVLGIGILAAAALYFAGNASADSISGSIWANAAAYPADANGFTVPATTPDITVTLSNSNPYAPIISFYSSDDTDLTNFLTNGGDSLVYNTGADQTGSPCPSGSGNTCTGGINNDVMQFTGSAYLANGATYSFTKDDAMYLYIGGSTTPVQFYSAASGGYAVDAGVATPPDTVYFTYAGTSGMQSFTLDYAEMNGAPGQLYSSNFGVAPEPSSLLLLGTGLLGLAFLLFRKGVKPSLPAATIQG